MSKPKLILINGFAGSGKTTIARKYIDEHPLAMVIEGDELIVNIGHWLENEPETRKAVFALIKSMLGTYLSTGHDVVLPYLVTNATDVNEFERVAKDKGADFYEFVLHTDRLDAVARLLKRGTWGEAGLPPLTDKDLPETEKLITQMETELEKRPKAIVLSLLESSPDETYKQLLEHLG